IFAVGDGRDAVSRSLPRCLDQGETAIANRRDSGHHVSTRGRQDGEANEDIEEVEYEDRACDTARAVYDDGEYEQVDRNLCQDRKVRAAGPSKIGSARDKEIEEIVRRDNQRETDVDKAGVEA